MNENTPPPANRASAISIAFFFLKLAALLPLFGVAYAYSRWYIPLLLIGTAVPLFFSYAAGTIVAVGAKRAGVNWPEKAIYRLGLLAGAVVLYVAWAVWLNLVENTSGTFELGLTFLVSNISIPETLYLLMHPKAMATLMVEVSKVGTWGLTEEWIIKGFLLWLFWLAEAILAIGLAGHAAIQKDNLLTTTHSKPIKNT